MTYCRSKLTMAIQNSNLTVNVIANLNLEAPQNIAILSESLTINGPLLVIKFNFDMFINCLKEIYCHELYYNNQRYDLV